MTVITNLDIAQKNVLTYLKRMKFQNQAYYDLIILYSVKANEIVNYIEHPEACGKWPFDYVCKIEYAINQISKKNLIDFPYIEIQAEEDRVLSKLLKKNNFLAFGSNTFFKENVTVNHVIAYMERNEIIYSWNSDFVLKTQQLVNKVKEQLL